MKMGCCGKNDVEDESDSGEPVKYDPTFKGPIDNRSCTDVICCLIFVVCFLGMLAVGAWAYTQGDPTRLLYPTDSQGNLCGVGDYADKPNLFFFDLLDCAKAGAAVALMGCPTPQICVKECPSKNWVYAVQFAKEKALGLVGLTDRSGREDMLCNYNVNPLTSSKSVDDLVSGDECAAYYVASEPIVGRCVPSFIAKAVDKAGDLLTDQNVTLVDKLGNAINSTGLEAGAKALATVLNLADYGMKIYADVQASWWMILVGLGIAMIVAFIWIILMRWLAGPMVWITLIAFLGLFGFGTYYCFNKYVGLKDDPAAQGGFAFTTDLDYWQNLSDTWLAFGIIAAIFLGITLIVVIFLRQRILIAIALIKESSKAVGHMVFTLFWPLLPFVFQMVLFAFWGASALFLASMSKPQFSGANKTMTVAIWPNGSDILKPDGSQQFTEVVNSITEAVPCDPNENSTAGSVCNFLKYGGDEYTIYLQFYMLFMLFWTANFIVALGQITLAGAFASYYWAFSKPGDIPAFPVSASLWRSLRYHLGTIAFGSLIVAIVQMIRVCLEYLDHKLKGSEYKIAKFFLKCLKCCFWCLEKFIKFINKNAYILTAVYGYNFCSAAMKAFSLILRNILRVAVVDKVTDFLIFIGKMVVVAAVAVASFYYFSGKWDEYLLDDLVGPRLNFYLVPVLIIGFGSYVIASCFFSVYNMGVDTLFLCFLEDLERNDGSAEKPYYMSKELMKILGKKNDKLGKEEKGKKE